MPVLSTFYGIIIRMYKKSSGKHKMPHIHVEYSDDEMVIALDGTVLEGEIPRGKMKLLEAWMEIHREELDANWTLLSNGEQFFRIDPLKADMLQPRLTKVEPLDHMRLRLSYETGEVKVFDVEPYAEGSWFGELRDKAYFKSVRLLPGGIGIEWAGGQDIAPHELYELGVLA